MPCLSVSLCALCMCVRACVRACVRVCDDIRVCARADRWTMDIQQQQTHRLIDESMGGWKQ